MPRVYVSLLLILLTIFGRSEGVLARLGVARLDRRFELSASRLERLRAPLLLLRAARKRRRAGRRLRELAPRRREGIARLGRHAVGGVHGHARRELVPHGFAAVPREGDSERRPRGLVGARGAAHGPGCQRRCEEGEAVYITTGAAMPAGADAVVPIEQIERRERDGAGGEGDPATVTLRQTVTAGTWVRRRGSDARRGEALLQRGTEVRCGCTCAPPSCRTACPVVRVSDPHKSPSA